MQKNAPKSGAIVTWLTPEEAGDLADVVKYFINTYGSGNFKVHSLTNSTRERVNRYGVTLSMEGKEILAEWDEKEFGPKPDNFRPQRLWFSWNLLKIVK